MNLRKWVFSMALALASSLAMAAGPAIGEVPDGASVRLFPDGSYQVIAVASGEWHFDNAGDVRRARQAATKRAKAMLAKFLKEDIQSKEGMDEATKTAVAVSGDGNVQQEKVSAETVSSAFESMRNSSAALLTGVIVLSDEKNPADKSYRVMVGVSSKTLKVVQKLRGDTPESPTVDPSGVTTPAGADVNSGASGETTAVDSTVAPAGLPPVPKGWIVCVGMGADRKRAVQAALTEGIAQVYGQQLQNDERFAERSKTIGVQSSEGKGAMLQITDEETQSCTLTKTAGFVREFRIVQVVPKDGNQEATVYASIVNPRAGGTIALQVKKPTMRIEDRTAVYQLGPKVRKSGAEVSVAVQFALPIGLAKANKFLILNDESVKAVIENKIATEAMVATGLANASELMQAGQGLTPDMTLATEISDIKYSKKLDQDKKTKKFGTMYKMSAKLDVTLTNARSGQVVKSDSIVLSLDNDEIKGLLEENEDADLLSALLSKLAEPLEEWGKVK